MEIFSQKFSRECHVQYLWFSEQDLEIQLALTIWKSQQYSGNNGTQSLPQEGRVRHCVILEPFDFDWETFDFYLFWILQNFISIVERSCLPSETLSQTFHKPMSRKGGGNKRSGASREGVDKAHAKNRCERLQFFAAAPRGEGRSKGWVEGQKWKTLARTYKLIHASDASFGLHSIVSIYVTTWPETPDQEPTAGPHR